MTVKVLIVGLGDLGGTVAKRLNLLGMQVFGVRRSADSITGMTGMNSGEAVAIRVVQADVTQSNTLAMLESIQPNIIIYCVAAGGQTDAHYQAAYVDGLRHVLATQVSNTQLKHVFFVSSTRVYGQQTDTVLDESVLPIPADFGGDRMLEAEAVLQTAPCHATALRLSGIYGPGRLRMINLAQTPDHWPKQNSWTNRIHRDDAAAFIVFLTQQAVANNALQPCYIVTDSRPVSQFEVLEWIAAQLHISPSQLAEAKLQMPSVGKRLSNQLMLATGFKLTYPDYQAGYQSLLVAVAEE